MKWFKKISKTTDILNDKILTLNHEKLSFNDFLKGEFISIEDSLFKFEKYPTLSLADFWRRTLNGELSNKDFQSIVFDDCWNGFSDLISQKLGNKTFFLSKNKHFELENLFIPVLTEAFKNNIKVSVDTNVLDSLILYLNEFKYSKTIRYFDANDLKIISRFKLTDALNLSRNENKTYDKFGNLVSHKNQYQIKRDNKFIDFFENNLIEHHDEISSFKFFLTNNQGIDENYIDLSFLDLILSKVDTLNTKNSNSSIGLVLETNNFLSSKNKKYIENVKNFNSKFIFDVIVWFNSLDSQHWYSKEKILVSKKTFINVFNCILIRSNKEKTNITKNLRGKLIYFMLNTERSATNVEEILFHPFIIKSLKGEVSSTIIKKIAKNDQFISLFILSMIKSKDKRKMIINNIKNRVYRSRKNSEFQVEKDLIGLLREILKEYNFNKIKNQHIIHTKMLYIDSISAKMVSDLIKKSKNPDMIVFG